MTTDTEEKMVDKSPEEFRTYDLMETVQIIDPAELTIEQDVADGLYVRVEGRGEWHGVSVEPCFPLTMQGRFLVFRHPEEGEVGVLDNMDDLSPECSGALADELAKQHFIPVITSIQDIRREFHIPVWDVTTDRGSRRLELRARHDARRLPGHRLYVRDAENNGYLVPDIRRLDPVSRNLLDLNV